MVIRGEGAGESPPLFFLKGEINGTKGTNVVGLLAHRNRSHSRGVNPMTRFTIVEAGLIWYFLTGCGLTAAAWFCSDYWVILTRYL